MYIACSTLSFGNHSFEQALERINELRFSKIDLALNENGAHLKPSEIAVDVNRCAQMLRATGQSFAALHLELELGDLERCKDLLRAVCRLGRLLTVPVVTIPAALAGSDLADETKRLVALCKVAEAEGVILTVETHRDQVTADPAGALHLCEEVPGLGLTLDPSHYHVGPHLFDDYEDLYPHICHVRLRDTAPGKFQVPVGQGQLDYAKIINSLEREHYDRALTVDIRDLPRAEYAIEPEVRKLKYLLESMV